MSNEPDKIIYSMIRVSKKHGQKEVLKDISLSYFYGAKIGVLGLNGSGKSSLLKILAGVDQSFDGKTVLAPGHTIGYLEQEPLVDETRTVREVVEEGAAELVAIRDEYEAINAKFAEPMEPDEMDALIARQGEVQELIIATNPTVEGEATAHYLAQIARQHGVKPSRLAHGVPLGGELEYVDRGTLSHAFGSRMETP